MDTALRDRLQRTIALLGEEKAAKVFNASVMVIGCGAVGGYALEMIARLGFGKIWAVDFDVFEASNINRQILATTETIGRQKCEVACERVAAINPDAAGVALNMRIEPGQLDFIDEAKPDFVIDAIDDVPAKTALAAFLVRKDIRFVSAMGAALKTNPADIILSTLNKTQNCALARKVRHQLKAQGVNLAEVPCVYSKEQPKLPQTAILSPQEDDKTRNIMGSLPTITAIFGLTLANEVILKLSKAEFKA